MSMTSAERAALVSAATASIPAGLVSAGWNAIHFLAALYQAHGAHSAREVTDAIKEGTQSEFDNPLNEWAGSVTGLTLNFSGFIEGTTTEGFRAELTDPLLTNPQTGHFFSYVVWALDGIDSLEFTIALGHELASDTQGSPFQLIAADGPGDVHHFRRIVVGLPQDPNGTLDYVTLDSEFEDSPGNWSSRMVPYTWGRDSVTGEWSTEAYTGNSIQDLRCTVAGFHFGRLIRSRSFSNAAHAVRWLERNVLDSPCVPLPTGILAAAAS